MRERRRLQGGTIFEKHYAVSPEDHTNGRGGFNGEWFDSPGITDAEFDTEVEACAAIEKRFAPHGWTREDAPNMSGPCYRSPRRNHGYKWLCVYDCERIIGRP